MANKSCIPGFDEAINGERRDRALAIAGFPELICGIECKPLTFRRLEWLRAHGNPFICGGTAKLPDALQFLWIVSCPFQFKKNADGMRAFIEGLPVLSFEDLCREIDEYIDRAFLDAATGGAEEKPYVAFTVSVYRAIQEGYPGDEWTLEKILDTPLAVAFQLIKAADRARGYPVFNRRSDEIATQWAARLVTITVSEEAVELEIAARRAKGFKLMSQPSRNRDGTYSFGMEAPADNGRN